MPIANCPHTSSPLSQWRHPTTRSTFPFTAATFTKRGLSEAHWPRMQTGNLTPGPTHFGPVRSFTQKNAHEPSQGFVPKIKTSLRRDNSRQSVYFCTVTFHLKVRPNPLALHATTTFTTVKLTKEKPKKHLTVQSGETQTVPGNDNNKGTFNLSSRIYFCHTTFHIKVRSKPTCLACNDNLHKVK